MPTPAQRLLIERLAAERIVLAQRRAVIRARLAELRASESDLRALRAEARQIRRMETTRRELLQACHLPRRSHTMDEETRARFEAAVEHKKEESRERSEQHVRTGEIPGADP